MKLSIITQQRLVAEKRETIFSEPFRCQVHAIYALCTGEIIMMTKSSSLQSYPKDRYDVNSNNQQFTP